MPSEADDLEFQSGERWLESKCQGGWWRYLIVGQLIGSGRSFDSIPSTRVHSPRELNDWVHLGPQRTTLTCGRDSRVLFYDSWLPQARNAHEKK